jgi:hypothetical protein
MKENVIFTNAVQSDEPILRDGKTKDMIGIFIDYEKHKDEYICRFKIVIPRQSGGNNQELLHGYTFTVTNESYLQTTNPEFIKFLTSLVLKTFEKANKKFNANINVNEGQLYKMVAASLIASRN